MTEYRVTTPEGYRTLAQVRLEHAKHSKPRYVRRAPWKPSRAARELIRHQSITRRLAKDQRRVAERIVWLRSVWNVRINIRSNVAFGAIIDLLPKWLRHDTALLNRYVFDPARRIRARERNA